MAEAMYYSARLILFSLVRRLEGVVAVVRVHLVRGLFVRVTREY
jgi:hypothetical protein